jgi:hypothetical protein
MKRIFPFLFLLLIAFSSFQKTHNASRTENPANRIVENQETPDVYDITPVEWAKGAENVAFISVSEKYPLSEHPDSLAIPDISDRPFDEVQYLGVNGKYRRQFLSRTGISEHDKVFVFDYSTGNLLSFPVKKLNVVACINAYASEKNAPFDQSDYMIGFAVNKALLAGIEDPYYNHTLVAIGKESPFAGEKLTLIEWEKTDAKRFPVKLTQAGKQLKGFREKETYFFRMDSLDYFLREDIRNGVREKRHVLVLNNQSKEVLFERVYKASEGTSIAPLNLSDPEYPETLQWTGPLFKDKSPVIFGFLFHSFDCERIAFIGNPQAEFAIKCDNRH